jgi:uracil-DNA glycosylase
VLQPSLNALYEAMEADLGGGLDLHMVRNPDLTPLARQGVLLLNANLTCELGHAGAHAPFVDGTKQVWVWRPLMEFLFNALNDAEPMVMAFLGRHAQRYSKIPVPFHHRVLEVEHPIAGAYQGRGWRHERLFGRIHQYLEDLYPSGDKIQWFTQHPVNFSN